MAIKLREGETIQTEAHFHWTTYMLPGFWAAFGAIGIIGQIAIAASSVETHKPQPSLFWMFVFFFGPLCYKFLKNKSKCYVVTNQRIYIEEGILSKTKVDVPLSKINDISFSQGITQRMFGSGNLSIMTGNDKPNKLKDLDKPEEFREVLSKFSNQKAS